MSQPWQPASQPQPPQPDGGNPYAQSPSGSGAGAPPPMPPPPSGPPAGSPPGPPPGQPGPPAGPPSGPPGPLAGPPPGMPQQGFPGQQPGQPHAQPQFPGQPAPMPGMPPQQYPAPQAGARGSAVGAFFLGLLVSVVVSLIYAGIFFATYKDLTDATTVNVIYMLHAVLNGAAVGAVAGLVGRRSNGAHIAAGIVAALGAFFGHANAIVFVQTDIMGSDVFYLLRDHPFFPAEAWWGRDVESGLLSLLGLVLAAGAGWGIAKLIGSRR